MAVTVRENNIDRALKSLKMQSAPNLSKVRDKQEFKSRKQRKQEKIKKNMMNKKSNKKNSQNSGFRKNYSSHK